MTYRSRVKSLLPIILLILLTACTREQNYRGVPAPQWEHLTAEQKQLIVDRSYQDEMK